MIYFYQTLAIAKDIINKLKGKNNMGEDKKWYNPGEDTHAEDLEELNKEVLENEDTITIDGSTLTPPVQEGELAPAGGVTPEQAEQNAKEKKVQEELEVNK